MGLGIALVGFGEVGAIVAADPLAGGAGRVAAHDITSRLMSARLSDGFA